MRLSIMVGLACATLGTPIAAQRPGSPPTTAPAPTCEGTLDGTAPTPFTCSATFASRPGMAIGAVVLNGMIRDPARPLMVSVSVLFGEQLAAGSYTEGSTTSVRSYSIMAAQGKRPASAWVGASGTGDVPSAGTFQLNISSVTPDTGSARQQHYVAHGTLVATLPAAPSSASTKPATLKITF